ncbi:hypothetical protein LTR36_007863 [Oleoguttula mirabilis]|uniref:C3H1-type domain-containing protein n=1 Tax=Oleoguttula mirabilis TaxID=1507867 RepID=A0AAV9J9B0_9PEZI|nr:hypothetical protein LTR36_007863 [Oleoguttula mirabilis]
MPLELLPMEESDLDAFNGIMTDAFMSDIMGLLYPNGFSQADGEHAKSSALKAWRKNPDTIKKMKVVDNDLPDDDPSNKIVGVADWTFYPHERSEEELDTDKDEGKEDGPPPGIDVAFLTHFMETMAKCKRDILGGRPYVYLHILATHPRHHRRGVGAMQLKWGFEKADELGLPVYLESSPMGRPLYARMGFETVGWLPMDAKAWGAQKDIPHALMLRPAKTLDKAAHLSFSTFHFDNIIIINNISRTSTRHAEIERDTDARLLEAVRRAGPDGVLDLFHSVARIAFAQYGHEILKNDQIRRLLADQLAPSGDIPTGSRSQYAIGHEIDRRKPLIHPSRLQNLQQKDVEDDDEEPASVIPNPSSASGARVLAVKRTKPPNPTKPAKPAKPAKKKTSKTEILELLLDGYCSIDLVYSPDEGATIVRCLCASLKARCDDHQALTRAPITYQGRNNTGLGFNFDPTVDNGLHATLARTFTDDSFPNGQPLLNRLEAVLKVFVRWNPKMFAELTKGNPKYALNVAAPLTSTMDVLRAVDGLRATPTMPQQWPDFCAQIYNTVKKRVTARCPSSGLLQAPHSSKKKVNKLARELGTSFWAPTPDYMRRNFFASLEGCISDASQTAEQLDAALEIQVYRLALREPKAWPELKTGVAVKTEAAAEDADEEVKDEVVSDDAGGVSLSEEDEDRAMDDATDAQPAAEEAEMVPVRQSLVCMFHLQGRCPWGDACTADHP